jgi:hypothetical protein
MIDINLRSPGQHLHGKRTAHHSLYSVKNRLGTRSGRRRYIHRPAKRFPVIRIAHRDILTVLASSGPFFPRCLDTPAILFRRRNVSQTLRSALEADYRIVNQ